jgi:mono/diheme cytochrome c family protein
MSRSRLLGLALVSLFAGTACRGETSSAPPVVVLRNMWSQPKYVQQGKSYFFQDQRQMRAPVEGTLAREMEVSPVVGDGRTPDEGGFVDTVPATVVQRVGDMQRLVARGENRYGIYCTPCHDGLGTGKGLVIQRAANQAFQPPSLHDERIRTMPDGQLYQTIVYGHNNMPPYGPQLPVEDRWSIVSYVRALQLSQANSRGVAK